MLDKGRGLSLFTLALVLAATPALTPVDDRAATSTLDWTQASTGGPSPREGAIMAYDSGRSRTVLFGGAEPGPTGYSYDSDTWEFDGLTWTRVATSGPPAGGFGNVVYDSARGVSVMFGGTSNSGLLAAATWEWNGTAWALRTTAHTPPARLWAGMVYDSNRHVTVLFGGSGTADLNDTWEYDGTDWRQVTTAHTPPARMGLGLAYDPVRSKTVMFGGHSQTISPPRFQDTWEYDGTDWTQISIANPPNARFWHSMTYDAALGQVVMFGGDYFVPFVALGPNSETWGYDGISWQQLAPTDHPSPRIMAPMVYDSAHADLVLFGGSEETNPDIALGDTWTFGTIGPAPAAALSVPFILFGGGTPVLLTVQQTITLSNPGAAPLAITSIGAGGDFSTTDDCPRAPATLAVGSQCDITVSFRPTTGDPVTSTLTVTDNAGTGTQSIQLSGQGVFGFLSASPAPLDLGAAVISTTGPTLTGVETITIPAQASAIFGFTTTSPFSAQNIDCPLNTALASGTTCHVQVNFAPSAPGSYSGQLVIRDDETGGQRVVSLSATALAFPAVTISLQTFGQPLFFHAITAQATTNATSGTATFTFNGHQLGNPVDIDPSGTATAVIPLDNTTVPGGAGTYMLSVAVHPTDNHADAAASQLVTVTAEQAKLIWTGTSTMLGTGSSAALSVIVSQPLTDTQVDYTHDSVWVRFDVTDAAGNGTTYYAQVSASTGIPLASISTAPLVAGAYRVRIRLVAAQGSDQPNPYLTDEDAMTVLTAQPAKGGYVAGLGSGPVPAGAFEFVPGSAPSGAFQSVSKTTVIGPDGKLHEAWEVATSTSVDSITSHSHTVTVTGTVTISIFDAFSGERYSAFDRTTTFTLVQSDDGSVNVVSGDGGFGLGLPPGSAVNHL